MGGDAVVSIVHHCDWKDLPVESCDLLCVDAPYSEKTHKGHDEGSMTANRALAWSRRVTDKPITRPNQIRERRYAANASSMGRSSLDYSYWTSADVDAFVEHWVPRTNGWFVSLTDDQLAPAWAAALERAGRYVFSPLACVEPGSRVRMSGDGPSQWTCYAIVARPKRAPYSKWGALPGAYIPGPNDKSPRPQNDGKGVVGGKPRWLMDRLILDYSRPGDLVVDPCCGAATTGVAALRHGRRFIGGDAMAEHVVLAREAIAAELELSTVGARKAGQVPLFGEVANG